MKKIVSLLVLILCLFSCSDGTKFNTPSFQGIKDGNVFWKASEYSVDINDKGYLTFSGSNSLGTLNLKVPSVSVGTYVLGNVSSMEALFIDDNTTSFSTRNVGGRGPYNYSDGEIIIEEIDFTANTFTGTFRFNAYDVDGLLSVNFMEGVFYKMPLTTGNIPATVVTCTDVQAEALLAFDVYQNADRNNAVEYQAACDAYKITLLQQRIYCGDPQGYIQDRIDALGDCIL